MTTIRVISQMKGKPRCIGGCDDLRCLRLNEDFVSGKAKEWFDRAWGACSNDPASAGEDEIMFMSMYK